MFGLVLVQQFEMGFILGIEQESNMGSVVTRNVGTEEAVTGNFAIPHKDFIANLKK